MSSNTFDLVVIGAGPGGYVCAIRAAQLGMSVAIIEREHMGGICLNWGCIPAKTMLRSAEIFQLIQRSKEFGLSVDNIKCDLESVISRSKHVANQLSQGVGFLLKKNKIDVIMGEAKLGGNGIVHISGKSAIQTLHAKNLVLATGARARELPGLESDSDLIWTYKDALRPKRMPKKLLVIGSGAIGIEFASFYNTLGANTTVVEVMNQILPLEDAEISAFAKKQFEKQGMRFLENATVKELERNRGIVTAHLEQEGKQKKETFDTVISAVGIVGNIENLGLEKMGISTENTHVVTDAYCRTSVQDVFAIGDISGAPWLAHKASHEGVMVAEIIAGLDPHPVKAENIAGCTYCHPQIASVGFTEEKARKSGYSVKVGRFPFIGNGKAIALGEAEGMVKTVFDSNTGELLGAHMVGAEVTELIQGYVVARQLETTEKELMETVFPHPTLSEMMHESVLDAYDRAIHT